MSRKKKEVYSYTLVESFPRKDPIKTTVQGKRQFLSLLKKSKAISFDVQIWHGLELENEGVYLKKEDATFAFKCFVEEVK